MDISERLMVGGHAGVHSSGGAGGTLFLSGGSGLAFSRALAAAMAEQGEALARGWFEDVGGREYGCVPCADLFFVYAARHLGATILQRPGFYAFWPHYYPPHRAVAGLWSTPTSSSAPGVTPRSPAMVLRYDAGSGGREATSAGERKANRPRSHASDAESQANSDSEATMEATHSTDSDGVARGCVVGVEIGG